MSRTENRFHVDLPDGWEDQTVYAFKGPDDDDQQHLMLVAIDRKVQHEEIEPFAREKTQPIIDGLQGLEVLKDEEITVEGGNPAWETVFKWVPGEGLVTFQRYVFILADEMGFTVSCSFSKKTFKTVGLQMKEMVETLFPGTYSAQDGY